MLHHVPDGQEVKQEKGLTQESHEVVWIHPESEGDKGILKYNVMEKPVDAVLMQEWEVVKEPSFTLCGSLVVMNAGREMKSKLASLLTCCP